MYNEQLKAHVSLQTFCIKLKRILFIAILLCSMCGMAGCESSSCKYNETIDADLAEVTDSMQVARLYMQQFEQNGDVSALLRLLNIADALHFSYSEDDLEREQCRELFAERLRVDSMRMVVEKIVKDNVSRVRLPLFSCTDQLMEATERRAFYASKGDTLNISASSPSPVSLAIYNANSRQQLRAYGRKTAVEDRFVVPNSAIYLMEINPVSTQYVDAQLTLQTQDIDMLRHPKMVKTKQVEATKGEWQSTSIEGVKMTSLFEEPRKFTLRGQLKAAFSGSYRALVALQVPSGAKDVLYSLRVSTNETDQYEDGRFNEKINTSYHKVRFLGLPVYESTRGSGLLATILGENVPVREEDAYINMYVFFDAGQARKFQDGKPTSELKYHVDYSTMGTQSCTGRIPAQGRKTIYLGFENERMRYNNYVWLEAVSAVPHTEYFKTQYSVGEGDEEEK